MSYVFPCYTKGTGVYPCSFLLERCTWNSTEVGINSINSSSCSSKHFVVCAIFAQGTWCRFTQRLLHSASGNTINLKRISVKEVITIVLMWTCSSILNLLNPMPWQVWNLIILQGQVFFFLFFLFQPCTYVRPEFYISVHKVEIIYVDFAFIPRWGNKHAAIITRKPIFLWRKTLCF